MFVARIVILFCALTSCSRARLEDSESGDTKPAEGTGRDRGDRQSYATVRLETGFMGTRNGAGRVFPIVDAAAWSRFVGELQGSELLDLTVVFPSPPSFAAGSVLLFVEFPDGSGSEIMPVVDDVVRAGDRAVVRGHWRVNPRGSMTDNLSRQWVLVRVENAGIKGASLELEVREGVEGAGGGARGR